MHIVGYQQWIDDLLAKARDHGYVYMIETRKAQSKYFFLTLAQKTEHLTQVLWTPSLKNGHIFFSEENVEEFKADHISPRKASIIRIPALEALLSFT